MEICTSHYKEDINWLLNTEYIVNIIHKEGGDLIDYTYCIQNIGYESTAYLTYIIERYETLPEYTVFLHGHENSSHQLGDRSILDLIKDANIKKYSYIPLCNAWKCFMRDIHANGILKIIPAMPELFITCQGAQFIVSKDAIKNNSINFYKNLLNKIQTKHDAILLEFSWHVIFTKQFSLVPHDDFFEPPIKEIFYIGCNIPFNSKDVKLCYMGNNVPNNFISIKCENDFKYFEKRAALFILFDGDNFSYNFLENIEKIVKIPNENFLKFKIGYDMICKKLENIYKTMVL